MWALALGVSLGVGARSSGQEGPAAPGEAGEETQVTASDPVDPVGEARRILNRMLEANGGWARIDQIRSLRLRGKITTPTGLLPFTMIKSRPNRMYLAVEQEEYRVITVCNGKEVQRRVESNRGERKVLPMEAGDRLQILENSSFDSPLLRALRAGTALRVTGKEKVGDLMCLVVETPAGVTPRFRFFLDQTRSHELRREMPDLTPPVASELSNYRKVGDIWIPFVVEEFRDGQRQARVEVEEVELNPGVFGSFFTPLAEPPVSSAGPAGIKPEEGSNLTPQP